MDRIEFEKLWSKLPESLKSKRIRKSHQELKSVYKKQLKCLKSFKESNSEKDGYHLYVFNAVENFWDNVEFAFQLGKKNSMKNFVFYPGRLIMETYLRFSYFSNQSEDVRNEISDKELLRIYRMLYKRALRDNDKVSAEELKKTYNQIRGKREIKDIDSVKKKELEPFYDIVTLIDKAKVKEKENYYMIYEYLAEATHGKTVSTIIRKNSKEFEEFRRTAMLIVNICKDMLVLVDDNFCNKSLKNEILESIKKSNKEIKEIKNNINL
jgi:hypothetical protein